MKALSEYLIPVEDSAFGPLQTQLLQKLCQLYSFPVAILYLADAEESRSFNYEAGSGFSGNPTPVHFSPGEGLLGQAVLEKRVLTDRFPAHLFISPLLSLLVELDSVFWYAIPLLYQEQVQGLLVLTAAEDKTSELEREEWQEFLREWGAYLQSVRSRRYIQALLEKTQLQNQELASREEELRQNLEELSVTQEEMRRAQELLSERTRWQELVIDLFSITSSATIFEGSSLMRIFLAQSSRFMGAQGAVSLWKDPESRSFRLLNEWSARSISQLWPAQWSLAPELLGRLERERKTVSVVASELLAEGVPELSGWYVAPFFDAQTLRGLLLYGFSEVHPLPEEVEKALRSLAIAFFSALERINRAFTKDFPLILGALSEVFGGKAIFLPAEAIRSGDVPWLGEIALVQRESYLSALRDALEKDGFWKPPLDIPVKEVGFTGYQGIWMLRIS